MESRNTVKRISFEIFRSNDEPFCAWRHAPPQKHRTIISGDIISGDIALSKYCRKTKENRTTEAGNKTRSDCAKIKRGGGHIFPPQFADPRNLQWLWSYHDLSDVRTVARCNRHQEWEVLRDDATTTITSLWWNTNKRTLKHCSLQQELK